MLEKQGSSVLKPVEYNDECGYRMDTMDNKVMNA